MKNLSNEVVEKIETRVSFLKTFFFFSKIARFMWKNMIQPDRLQMSVWRMRIACWKPKTTNTHSEYVILIDFSIATVVA
jgi:hypothetical protein